jgi:hypothetical protein
MKIAVIIQGEGKGHFSQAMEAIARLQARGDEVTGCYLGNSLFRRTSRYFRETSPLPVRTFISPNFIRTPDRKGMHIFFSLLVNTLMVPIYLLEALRLGIMMRRDGSDRVINFYDPVGALAGSWMKRRTRRIMISHHFYLSHPDFIHPHGMEGSYFWLQLMNRIMLRHADDVNALSFRKGSIYGKIKVVPPLVSESIRKAAERSVEASPNAAKGISVRANEGPDLCYFLNPGYLEEMLEYYRDRPQLEADIFLEDPEPLKPPFNVRLHQTDRETFLTKMLQAGRVICTAGFDTVAEAFCLGIPVYIIPSENHYEQYCNALDASRTGMAFQLESVQDLDEAVFEPAGHAAFAKWMETGQNLFLAGSGK